MWCDSLELAYPMNEVSAPWARIVTNNVITPDTIDDFIRGDTVDFWHARVLVLLRPFLSSKRTFVGL